MPITITEYDGDRTLFTVPSLPGWRFQASMSADSSQSAPWEEYDGHGKIRWASTRSFSPVAKQPGEVLIHEDRGECWLYDFAAAVKTARQDGWRSLEAEETLVTERTLHKASLWFLGEHKRALPRREVTDELLAPFRKPLTKGEAAVLAVEADMKRLRGYLNNDWGYVVVKVEVTEAPDKLLMGGAGEWGAAYLGRVESDSDGPYLHEIWEDQAGELVLQAAKHANEALPNGMQVPTPPPTQDELLDLRKQAVTLYNTGLGDPTIEVEADAAVTLTEDGCPEPGAWVQAWVYVPFERAKVS